MIFKDGFSYGFDCNACAKCGGKCCTGESGYIFLDGGEISAFAKEFGLSEEEFLSTFCFKVDNRFSLKEKLYQNGFACVFFDEKNKNCGVYNLRPKQCRTFPFWEYFKHNFKELEAECIGVKKEL